MELALNGATIMKADLVTDIEAASEAGFSYLEIWAAKLREFLKSRTTRELQGLLAARSIAPYSINSIERVTFRDERGHASLLVECEEICELASMIGCPYVVVVPGLVTDGVTRERVVDESSCVLDEMAGIASRFRVKLAFEFLGQAGCSVQTLDLASDIVERVGRADVGLVLDSFHFYAGGSRLESIEALNPERLFIFHINDAEDLPRDRLEDRHRLMPGMGILPLRQIVDSLEKIGYTGAASVEIFRPEYWERDPREVAREAYSRAAQIIA
ncbi:MAG TPA: sugar phosphate isomerase/epimerase [Blastocatellia bacterium]|nr:sugar phosphate isomerase/epimerase [Blastocatellia bacterium]